MSDRLKKVIDTNLGGMRVTDRQIDAMMQRIHSQDASSRRTFPKRRTFPMRAAAALLVLFVAVGAVLGTTVYRMHTASQPKDVTRQGDWLTSEQARDLLTDTDLPVSLSSEELEALLEDMDAAGGISLSELLEKICAPNTSIAQWPIASQASLSRTLEKIGYLGILPTMTREPLESEITPQEAVDAAAAYIRENDDAQADFSREDFYTTGIRFLSGTSDGTCTGAYYCVSFDSTNAFGTNYEVSVDASTGDICRMRSERGAGRGHTADEVTSGFRRIFGYDMHTWTNQQLRVYVLALSDADESTLQTVHQLFLSVGRDGFPEIPDTALTREQAIAAATSLLNADRSSVIAAQYIAGASGNMWKVAVRQTGEAGGQSLIYLELDGNTGDLLTKTTGARYGLTEEFFPSQLISTIDYADVTRGVPVLDEETALSAAYSAVEGRYGHVLDAAYSAYVEDSLAELFSTDTGSAVVIFTKETEGVAQGDTYWVALDWYGEALDIGCNLNPLDSVRFTMLMDGYLPSSYNEACLTTMKSLLAERMAEESAAAKLEADGMAALADALLNQEIASDLSDKVTRTQSAAMQAALDTLNAHVCYDWQMLLLRDNGEVIWHFLLSTDVGCYAVDVRDSDLSSAGAAEMVSSGAPWALHLLTVRAWNDLPEDVRERTITLGACSSTPGIIYGMQVKYIVSRYVRLYGASMQDWEPATLRAFREAVCMSTDSSASLALSCLKQTNYPDMPDNALSKSLAAAYAARALDADEWTLRGGVLIEASDGSTVWKLSLTPSDGSAYVAEVDALTGEVYTIRQRSSNAALLGADGTSPDENWFGCLVLDEAFN